MTTQSNKQSQNVKVVINNNVPTPPRRRRQQRRKPQAPAEQEVPMPYNATPQFAKGLSPYANRPMNFSPTVQLIHSDNGGQIPSYFETQLTNQSRTLEQMRRQMEDELAEVRNEMFGYAQNPEDIARIDRNIEELRNHIQAQQQPAQQQAPPQPAPPQEIQQEVRPPMPLQIPQIPPQAPPQGNRPMEIQPAPQENMEMPFPRQRVLVNEPSIGSAPRIPIQVPQQNLQGFGLLRPVPPRDALMFDVPPALPAPPPEDVEMPPALPPPDALLALPPPDAPLALPAPITHQQYIDAYAQMRDVYVRRTQAKNFSEKQQLRQQILSIGRSVGIDSNNISVVRRELERLVSRRR